MDEKISIILPTYNGAENIAKSIESILRQTYEDWELIVVNDCSTDNTLNIVKEYAGKDSRISVVSNEVNKKLPASLNIGFSHASGSLLTWTSDDNTYHADALEVMAKALTASDGIDMVYADFDVINSYGNILRHSGRQNPDSLIYTNVIGACFLYRKSLADSIGGYDTELFLAEDYEYWIRAFLHGNIKYIDENLYDYMWHDKSLSVTKKKEVAHKTFEAKNKHFDKLLARCNAQDDRNKLYWSMLDLLFDEAEKEHVRKGYYRQDRAFRKADLQKRFRKKITDNIFGHTAWMIINSFRRIPAFDVFILKYVSGRNGNKLIRLVPTSMKTYCAQSDCKLSVIESEQERIVYEPAYFRKSEGTQYSFKAPAVYVAELEDVVVHGGTGLIIAGDMALTDIVANDTENRVRYTCGTIRRGENNAFYLEVADEIEEIDTAINLCGLASSNYYHLTFEILSRYEYVKEFATGGRMTVLLGEEATWHPQYIELINTVLEGARIRYVSPFNRIHCRKLIYPSMNTWMPMNVRRKNLARMSDNLIAESAVANIRKAVKKSIPRKERKKIFISRKNASISRIKNEVQVAVLFEQAGYSVVCTEELSFREQVELFSSVSCVVGASGAALTNIVYCNPGTVFGCIIPQKYGFCIYSSIAYMAGCRNLFLDAKILTPRKYASTEQCKVDLKVCREYITELERLIENQSELV